jgi:hypothetical protein
MTAETEEVVEDMPIRQIFTSCRDCVFAEYNGDTVTDKGCVLGRPEKFEENGAEVIGIDDGKKRFLQIVGRYCNHCHNSDSPYIKGKPRSEWASAVRQHVKARVAILIYLNYASTLEHLTWTLESVEAFDQWPYEVVVILDDTKVTPASAIYTLRNKAIGCTWQVIRTEDWLGEHEKTEYRGNRRDRAIDIGVSKLNAERTTYYTISQAGTILPVDLISRIDTAINDEMIPLSVVVGPGEIITIQTKMHNHPFILGHRGWTMAEKLPWIIEQYGSGFKVLHYEELPEAA